MTQESEGDGGESTHIYEKALEKYFDATLSSKLRCMLVIYNIYYFGILMNYMCPCCGLQADKIIVMKIIKQIRWLTLKVLSNLVIAKTIDSISE